jgi:hypothetical protein
VGMREVVPWLGVESGVMGSGEDFFEKVCFGMGFVKECIQERTLAERTQDLVRTLHRAIGLL